MVRKARKGHICGLIEGANIEPMTLLGDRLRKRDNETTSALHATNRLKAS
jgi:hypothetical protein